MAGIVLKSGGTETNAGVIVGTYYGVEIYGGTGTVVNGGSISATASGGYGILLENGGAVTNREGGYITGNTAISLTRGGTITNAFGALITSDVPSGAAVAVSVEGAAGAVLNSGMIFGKSSASNFTAVFLGDGGSVTNYATGEIKAGPNESAVSIQGGKARVTNAGTIFAGAYAVSLGAGGGLTNTGEIYGRVAIATTGGGVTNSGSIFASGAATTEGAGIAISVGRGAKIVNLAGGSIAGGGANGYGVSMYGGGSIVNAGTIGGTKAAIVFTGAGTNTLTLQTGSTIVGAVIGSTAQGAFNDLMLTGAGAANNAFVHFDTLSLQTTGSWTLGGVSNIGATSFSTGTLAITGALTTALDETGTAIVAIRKSGVLTLTGASTLNEVTTGLGMLVVTGATTIGADAGFSVAHWSILGSTARVSIDETLFYGGGFTAGSGAVLDLSAGPLVLTGTSTFSGARMIGNEKLKTEGATTVSGLIVAGVGSFVNLGTLTQSGAVVLGNVLSEPTKLVNAAAATWDIVNDSGIALGASQPWPFANSGLFEKTAGSGVSVIAPMFDNGAEVLVSSGTLDFRGDVSGTGAAEIIGAATLEFDSGVTNGQTIDFAGAGGVLDLGSPTSFSGALKGFDTTGSNDAVELLGSWSIGGYTQNSSSMGTLVVDDGSRSALLTFDGIYNPSLFHTAVGTGKTTLTYG